MASVDHTRTYPSISVRQPCPRRRTACDTREWVNEPPAAVARRVPSGETSQLYTSKSFCSPAVAARVSKMEAEIQVQVHVPRRTNRDVLTTAA